MEKAEKLKFEALAFREDGAVCLIASALTGSIWNGSCWVFSSYEELKDIAYETLPILSTTLPSGGSDVCWLEDDVIAVATDTAEISMWKHGTPGHSLQKGSSLFFHDRMVLSLDRTEVNKTDLLSSGADGRCVLWNVDTMKCVQQFKAHSDMVWCSRYQPNSPNVIATTGQDRCVKVWDVRSTDMSLKLNLKGIVSRALCWSSLDENVLVTGKEDGSVVSYDVRSSAEEVLSCQPHTRPIHRMIFVPKKSYLATVSNDCSVHVQDMKNHISIFTSRKHDDFVHGLTWDPLTKTLVSCSWDGQILGHSLPSKVENDHPVTGTTD
jgi:WD40 repeat protein